MTRRPHKLEENLLGHLFIRFRTQNPERFLILTLGSLNWLVSFFRTMSKGIFTFNPYWIFQNLLYLFGAEIWFQFSLAVDMGKLEIGAVVRVANRLRQFKQVSDDKNNHIFIFNVYTEFCC
jgi:hypothetical protein